LSREILSVWFPRNGDQRAWSEHAVRYQVLDPSFNKGNLGGNLITVIDGIATVTMTPQQASYWLTQGAVQQLGAAGQLNYQLAATGFGVMSPAIGVPPPPAAVPSNDYVLPLSLDVGAIEVDAPTMGEHDFLAAAFLVVGSPQCGLPTVQMATSVWNPADAAGKFAVSGGGLIVSKTVTGWATVRGDIGHSTGRRYFEFKCTADSSDGLDYEGFASAGFDPATYLGNAIYSFGWIAGGKSISAGFIYGGPAPPGNDPHAGYVYQFAIDFDAGSVWYARNNTWVYGDPGSSTSPSITFTPATVGALFPALSIYDTAGGTWALQTTAASLTYGLPAGFTAWDG
jgi:hypothetical protein